MGTHTVEKERGSEVAEGPEGQKGRSRGLDSTCHRLAPGAGRDVRVLEGFQISHPTYRRTSQPAAASWMRTG